MSTSLIGDAEELFKFLGRTGRFGRKGVSINFVHNEKTWKDMQMIEEALGKPILRVETNDVDVMEDVRINPHQIRRRANNAILCRH